MSTRQGRICRVAAGLVLLALGAQRAGGQIVGAQPPHLEVAGLEVGAVDLERSAEFYTAVLGFKPAGERSADTVRLVNGGVELTLRKASVPATFDPEKGAHFYLNVEVSDLAATARELEKRGLALLGPPKETAIGHFARLRDPAGNVHQVVESKTRGPQPFPPRIFNIGIRMASMAAAKGFYCRGLGFAVLSESHPPPIIPLKLQGAAPLILFEGATLAAEEGEGVARAVLVLAAADLAPAVASARQAGLTIASQGEGWALLADPSGNRVKLRQAARPTPPPAPPGRAGR